MRVKARVLFADTGVMRTVPEITLITGITSSQKAVDYLM